MVEHAVERLIVISQAGVTRPVVSSLSKALWGTWGDVGKAMHWNLLKHKRLGELAAIRECRETRGETTYTIVRATNLGNSTYEGSWGVAPVVLAPLALSPSAAALGVSAATQQHPIFGSVSHARRASSS